MLAGQAERDASLCRGMRVEWLIPAETAVPLDQPRQGNLRIDRLDRGRPVG
jgi:hypothetical protein